MMTSFYSSLSIILACLISFSATAINMEQANTLEGKSFPGSIKAQGLIGFSGVKGTLSFNNGLLTWTALHGRDSGVYQIKKHQQAHQFKASVIIENDEHIQWTGRYDGQSLYDVKAVWSRNTGDFIHDRLLPDVVTLIFTPD
ncbi:hypothetical protein [Psychrobium sp. 1_MG-2023]|uniref:hypothetical protein n=1 Tax=Psychrobium sp. 1_MG-2023 TaxID=3062624 RepID=UPI000C321884|nr:hypothetical protein [Psychrobium sp. 1_MG-2023]MDP2559774.1 hypothetical protein [Psychrobium sp. 1_MG-2023]PKF59118.1 hypothetical protein CW748_02715 [Alteromonadales bacterium alter-6D02]